MKNINSETQERIIGVVSYGESGSDGSTMNGYGFDDQGYVDNMKP